MMILRGSSIILRAELIRIAVAKGRVSKEAIALLAEHGVHFEDSDTSRKLIIPDIENKYEIILVKPSDTAIYVEQGVADCGIVGKDILAEDDPDVYRLFALDIGKCKMCVAGKEGTDIHILEKVVVASKYVNSAKTYFESIGKDCEVIKLNGSVELAPLLHMSDVIVDIVQTGTTLKENGLVILKEIYDISSVFIVNKAALKTKHDELIHLMEMFRN